MTGPISLSTSSWWTTAVLIAMATGPMSIEAFQCGGRGMPSLSSSVGAAFVSNCNPRSSPLTRIRSPLIVLNAENDEKEGEAEEMAEDVAAEVITDEASEEGEEEEASEEGEEEPEVDPEVQALKDEIVELESQLKQKNRDLNRFESLADEYTKSGYARKVAEMEEFRKLRSVAFTNNKFTARATVLQSFLPILEKLQSLNEGYAENEFAQKYSALAWDFNNVFKDLDATEFTAEVGGLVDARRMSVVEEVYSEDFEKGCVVKPVKTGMEIQGNVMRMAQVVASLGSESEEVEESGDDENPDGGEADVGVSGEEAAASSDE